MPQTPSAGRGLIAPALTDIADGPDGFADLIGQLDAVASIYSGTLAARGAVVAGPSTAKGAPGTFYYATDTAELFVSMSGAWMKVTTEPGVPIAASLEYGGAGDPADTRFLLEDGRTLNSTTDTTLATLFARIGTTYGGSGASAFQIPDSRGRVTVAPDNMGTARGDAARLTASDGLGNAAGAESHNHTIPAEAPGTNSAGSHSHGISTDAENGHTFFTGGPYGGMPSGSTGIGHIHGGGTDTTGSHSHAVNSHSHGGASGSQSGMQPYVVKNKIIRVR